MPRARLAVLLGAVFALSAVAAVALAASGSGGDRVSARPSSSASPHASGPADGAVAGKSEVDQQARALGLGTGHPRAVEPTAGEVADAGAPSAEDLAASGAKHGRSAPTLDSLQTELQQLKRQVGISGHPRVTENGLAAIPSSAPASVRSIVDAANKIALYPYRYGGGHTSNFRDKAYDCSASVSYALAAAGLLKEPLDSTAFMKWGAPGRGKWVTIYANEGHAFMVVDGLRFDTVALAGGGTRWSDQPTNAGGFTVRHPPGL